MTHDELLELIAANEEFYGDGTNRTPSWTALREVVELHTPVLWQKIEMVCDGCGMDIEQNYNSAYPCPTIQTIEKELQ